MKFSLAFVLLCIIIFVILVSAPFGFERQYIIQTERSATTDIFGTEPTDDILFADNLTVDTMAAKNQEVEGYFNGTSVVLDGGSRIGLVYAMPHELCHSVTRKMGCKELENRFVARESICDAYSYYRHPYIYRFISSMFDEQMSRRNMQITAPLMERHEVSCLERFFRDYAGNCATGNVLKSLEDLCSVDMR